MATTSEIAEPQGAPPVSTTLDTGNLRVAYEQICREHEGIADFRAKLLALLPIASGGGLLLLGSEAGTSIPASVMMAIGLLGVCLVTGLFLYELRGGHRCMALCLCAAELEQHFLGPYQNHGAHSYMGVPEGVGPATNTWAALVIYPALIASWSFVGALGVSGSAASNWHILFAAAVGGAASWLGWKSNDRARRRRKEVHARCPYVKHCLAQARSI